MRKIAIIFCLAALLCGCESGMENVQIKDITRLDFACINGHLYITNYTYYGHEVSTPLFAADSDTPMLVRCPGRDLSQAGQ